MNDFGTINRLAVRWVDFMGGRSYEIAIVFLIAACLWLLIARKASAFLGYGLFMLVLIKAVLPFNIPFPALLNELPISSHTFSAPIRDWGMRPVFPPMRHELAHAGETMETAGIENAGEMPSAPVTNERETGGQRNENQISFSALFMLVWTAVVCFLLIRFIRSQWIIHRFILRAKQGPPVDFPFDFDSLCVRHLSSPFDCAARFLQQFFRKANALDCVTRIGPHQALRRLDFHPTKTRASHLFLPSGRVDRQWDDQPAQGIHL
jgi:hypothetical protein